MSRHRSQILSERELIREIRVKAGVRSRAMRVGIGDDCAVLRVRSGQDTLVTTDLSIEGVHFRRDWQSAESIGHRCLVRGLSDIAAMGGTPVAAFLSLSCPQGTDRKWLDGFFEGLLRLARRCDVTLAGGDTAVSPASIFADIVVVGSVATGAAALRSGAQPGDLVYTTGALGGAARDLRILMSGTGKLGRDSVFLWPEPQIRVGRKLRDIASAMIDTSDGLSVDLAHICEESAVTAILDPARIPIAPGASLEDALHGGEDYQLLFTAPVGARIPKSMHRIGEIVRKKRYGVYLERDGKLTHLPQHGWEHQL
ncbi:MAG TPA: thiamine-phosphate kinase [Terriglobales bacterium]